MTDNNAHENCLNTSDDIDDIDELKILSNEGSVDSVLSHYLKSISNYKPYSMEEEQRLGHLIRKGDKNAFKKLILANLKFVVSIANKYRNTGVPLNDLINQGNIGLLEAAKRYDPTKDVKFITYAVWWILQAIIQVLSEQTALVKLPVKQANIMYRINSAEERLTKLLNRTPTITELSEVTNISEHDIINMIRVRSGELSLDALISDDGSNFFIDTIEHNSINTEETIIKKTLKISIDEIIAALDKREAKIISQRFGIGDETSKTLEEI